MRIIVAAVAVLLSISHSDAQEKDSSGTHLLLRTNVYAPLEADANVVLGVGIQWKSRWAVNVDAGYIFMNEYENARVEDEKDRVRGLKLRTEFRYYFRDVRYNGRTTWYIAPAFHYKKVNSIRWEEFGMNCVNGNCSFFQIDTYRRVKNEFGGLLTAGAFTPLFGGNRFALETFLGLGVKVKKMRNTDLPPGASFGRLPGTGWFSFDREGVYPMFPMGMRLSFRLY